MPPHHQQRITSSLAVLGTKEKVVSAWNMMKGPVTRGDRFASTPEPTAGKVKWGDKKTVIFQRLYKFDAAGYATRYFSQPDQDEMSRQEAAKEKRDAKRMGITLDELHDLKHVRSHSYFVSHICVFALYFAITSAHHSFNMCSSELSHC